jgi:hypothetical protein
LYLKDFYRVIGEFHPVAHQALLITQRGELAVSEARGAFDPKLVSNFNSKNFGGSDYYDIWDSYLQIPTFLNVDLKAGFEKNSGLYLNPEQSVPEEGLYYAGVSIPIGQGLINHPRRIALRRGEITNQQLSTQAVQVLNNLLLDATHAYWFWFEHYQKYDLARRNLVLIQQRFEGIRSSALNGETAPIDSTEALIQVQQWTNSLRKAEVDLYKSKLLLQNFIWTDSIAIDNLVPQLSPEITSETIEGPFTGGPRRRPDPRSTTTAIPPSSPPRSSPRCTRTGARRRNRGSWASWSVICAATPRAAKVT